MKSPVSSLGPSTQKIIARIQKVRKAADKAARSERRFADYRYLRSVLRAYIYFEDNDLLPSMVEIAPSVLITPVRANWHPLRVIVDASCKTPDLKKRSRWTRALSYAVFEQISPKGLARFFRANGGIAGCADLASKISPRPKKPRTFDLRHTRNPRIIVTGLR